MTYLLAIIAALLPQTTLPVKHVQACELNHVMRMDEQGEWCSRLD